MTKCFEDNKIFKNLIRFYEMKFLQIWHRKGITVPGIRVRKICLQEFLYKNDHTLNIFLKLIME